MALRAKKPEAVQKRLKLFMFGDPGVGKTTAALQFPHAYVFDCEHGTDYYAELVKECGGSVFHTTDIDDVIADVKELASSKHDFKTILIDPVTVLWSNLVDRCEREILAEGGELGFGNQYGRANKIIKRLIDLLMRVDMNVIITSHAKVEYADGKQVGVTFDAYKKLDYIFDLVLQLQKRGKKRVAIVRKTRMANEFPDSAEFDWSYGEFVTRHGTGMEADVAAIEFATAESILTLKGCLSTRKDGDELAGKWMRKAGVDRFEDMDATTVAKCIEYLQAKEVAA